jgi:hypothetical protein
VAPIGRSNRGCGYSFSGKVSSLKIYILNLLQVRLNSGYDINSGVATSHQPAVLMISHFYWNDKTINFWQFLLKSVIPRYSQLSLFKVDFNVGGTISPFLLFIRYCKAAVSRRPNLSLYSDGCSGALHTSR